MKQVNAFIVVYGITLSQMLKPHGGELIKLGESAATAKFPFGLRSPTTQSSRPLEMSIVIFWRGKEEHLIDFTKTASRPR